MGTKLLSMEKVKIAQGCFITHKSMAKCKRNFVILNSISQSTIRSQGRGSCRENKEGKNNGMYV